jgi:HNH endonuclease
MARKPDTPCAGCGKLVYHTRTSLPAGQQTCHECRRKQPRPYGSRSGPPQSKGSCATCGGPLFGQAKIYCSRACSNLRPGRQTRQSQTCEICGKQYQRAGGKSHPTCSRACGVELRRRSGTLNANWPSKPIWVRNCVHCGVLFIARRARQETCSKTCSKRANWAKWTEIRRVAEHVCPCGAVISPARHKCDACLKQARHDRRRRERAKRQDVIISEPYTLAEIAERDHYLCGICLAVGKTRRQARVPMTKTVPHPRAPTIDHVIALVSSKDDSRANVQLAHFICNSRKSAGVLGTQQLALFGLQRVRGAIRDAKDLLRGRLSGTCPPPMIN